jgi:hypothetical protein
MKKEHEEKKTFGKKAEGHMGKKHESKMAKKTEKHESMKK